MSITIIAALAASFACGATFAVAALGAFARRPGWALLATASVIIGLVAIKHGFAI